MSSHARLAYYGFAQTPWGKLGASMAAYSDCLGVASTIGTAYGVTGEALLEVAEDSVVFERKVREQLLVPMDHLLRLELVAALAKSVKVRKSLAITRSRACRGADRHHRV
jgi:hypothetical protein